MHAQNVAIIKFPSLLLSPSLSYSLCLLLTPGRRRPIPSVLYLYIVSPLCAGIRQEVGR
jgi:hypothetical protein